MNMEEDNFFGSTSEQTEQPAATVDFDFFGGDSAPVTEQQNQTTDFNFMNDDVVEEGSPVEKTGIPMEEDFMDEVEEEEKPKNY